MKRRLPLLTCCLLLLGIPGFGLRLQAGTIASAFVQPPESARPWVFWYWMHGAVSREGIRADLEAMRADGIAGAYLMPIQDVTDPPLINPPVRQLSPEYWDMIRYAFREADRLGVQIAMQDCDGFATAGGPWITPDLAMQRVVWSESNVQGPGEQVIALPPPPTQLDFYGDIAVLAFPAPTGEGMTSAGRNPKVTCNVPGANPQFLVTLESTNRFRSEQPCWIQYAFDAPFTCRSIVVQPDGNNYQALRLVVEASDDGNSFRSLGRLETPRMGWQDGDANYTFSIVPTTARFFRFVFDPAGSEPGAEDLDSAKWKPILKVRSIELYSAPRLPDYAGKSGLVWRKSSRVTEQVLPKELCVPVDSIINLTERMDKSGALHWQVPAGRWTILRIGHTPTGHQNETGGGGKGLECDKFNPAAARVQFDGWFGRTLREVGPPLAGRVLKLFHVDSWEAGSQNWSPVFLDEFKRRRGYDPTPYLPTFAGIPVGSADVSERFLFDVRQTIADLTIDGFFKPMAELAHASNCVFSAESTAPTMSGDGMRHFGVVDIPMGEFWLRSPTHDKPNDIQDAVSGAHVYGRNIVQAEAFTELRLQWDESPALLKALADHNYCLGINRFVFHVFVQNPWPDRKPGMTLSGIGTFFQRDQTWWKPGRAWFDYVTRCQALLQQGRPVADLAYFTGEELPNRSFLPERLHPPVPHGFDADSINRDALLRLARVRDGRIQMPGGASYGVLILPDTDRMTPEVASKLEQLVRDGAAVVGRAPGRSPSLQGFPDCDREVQKIASRTWDKSARSHVFDKVSMTTVLSIRGMQPDCLVTAADGGKCDDVEWVHRDAGETQIYFLSNQRAARLKFRVSLRSTAERAEVWDPVSGEQQAARCRLEGGRLLVELRLAPHGSVFVITGAGSGALSEPAPGENEGDSDTLLELEGPWRVQFDANNGGPEREVEFPQLVDWTARSDPAIRHYSGTAAYTKTFEWQSAGTNGALWIDLGEVKDVAEVELNGMDCGVAWTEPFRVRVPSGALRRGTNRLVVRLTNTWANRLIGDHALPQSERQTWTSAPYRLGDTLLPAGLLGPVRIIREEL